MTAEERKTYAELHYKIIKLLTECETDDEYILRVKLANKIIGDGWATLKKNTEEPPQMW